MRGLATCGTGGQSAVQEGPRSSASMILVQHQGSPYFQQSDPGHPCQWYVLCVMCKQLRAPLVLGSYGPPQARGCPHFAQGSYWPLARDPRAALHSHDRKQIANALIFYYGDEAYVDYSSQNTMLHLHPSGSRSSAAPHQSIYLPITTVSESYARTWSLAGQSI